MTNWICIVSGHLGIWLFTTVVMFIDKKKFIRLPIAVLEQMSASLRNNYAALLMTQFSRAIPSWYQPVVLGPVLGPGLLRDAAVLVI